MSTVIEKKDLEKKELEVLRKILKLCQTSVKCSDCGVFLLDEEKQKFAPFFVLNDTSELKERLEDSVDQEELKKISKTTIQKRLWVRKDLNLVPLSSKEGFLGLFICLFEDSKGGCSPKEKDSVLSFADIIFFLMQKSIQRNSPKELELINQELLNQLKRLSSFEAILELADVIAHDINNPLQIILGKTQILLMKTKKEDGHRDLEAQLKVIEESANRISSLSKELSFFAKQAKGQVRSSEEQKVFDLDISQILGHACSLVRNRFKAKGIELDLKIEKDLPKVKGTSNKLESIFLTLLLNAKESIAEKGKLNVSAKKQGKYLQLDFSDTGERIPEDLLPKVFDPLLVAPGLSRKVGLKLSFVSEVVEEHQGIIEAKRKEDQNSFIIRFPIVLGGDKN